VALILTDLRGEDSCALSDGEDLGYVDGYRVDGHFYQRRTDRLGISTKLDAYWAKRGFETLAGEPPVIIEIMGVFKEDMNPVHKVVPHLCSDR
jgi:hypothetical protein